MCYINSFQHVDFELGFHKIRRKQIHVLLNLCDISGCLLIIQDQCSGRPFEYNVCSIGLWPWFVLHLQFSCALRPWFVLSTCLFTSPLQRGTTDQALFPASFWLRHWIQYIVPRLRSWMKYTIDEILDCRLGKLFENPAWRTHASYRNIQ